MSKYDNFDLEDFRDQLEVIYDKGYDQGLDDGKEEAEDRYSDGYNEGLDKGRDEERDRTSVEKVEDIFYTSDGYIGRIFPEFVQKLVDNR